MKKDDPKPDAPEQDVLLVHGISRTASGPVAHVLRKRGDQLEAGCLRPMESGKPLTGDLVRLRPRPQLPLLFDVEVEVASPLAAQPSSRDAVGPARASSSRYRRGWESIWGSDPGAEDALPN